MKPVKPTKQFQLHYKFRIAKHETLKQTFQEALNAFLEDPSFVDDHQLEGKMISFRSFSINDEYRVVYLETSECFWLIDVGTHDEVYLR